MIKPSAITVQVSGTADAPVQNVTLRRLTVDANYSAQENAATPRGIQVMWAG